MTKSYKFGQLENKLHKESKKPNVESKKTVREEEEFEHDKLMLQIRRQEIEEIATKVFENIAEKQGWVIEKAMKIHKRKLEKGDL